VVDVIFDGAVRNLQLGENTDLAAISAAAAAASAAAAAASADEVSAGLNGVVPKVIIRNLMQVDRGVSAGVISLLPGEVSAGTVFEIIGERGRRIQGFTNSGALVVPSNMSLADKTIISILPGEARGLPLGDIDESGRPLGGGGRYLQSGMLDARRQQLPSGDAYITGTTPNRQVKIFRGLGVSDLVISPVGHDPDAVWQYGETISYRRTLADTVTGAAGGRRMAFNASRPFLSPNVTRLTLSLVYGQSNSNGGNLLTRAISTEPVLPGRALMFSGGARLNYATAYRLSFDDIAGVCDLFEIDENRILRPGETPCSGLASGLLNLLPRTEATICNSFGIGSQSINALKKGTLPYQNILDAVQAAQINALASGFTRVVVPRLFWVQGEADNGMSTATYQALLDTLQSDLTADVQAITGQSEQVLFYVAQISSSPNMASAGPVLAALALHIAAPTRFRCTGPMYRYPFVDIAHLTSQGTRNHGEDVGRKIARLELATSSATCLYATAATLSGTTLTVTYAGAEGNLVLDTSEVSDPGQFGFAITQDSGIPPTLSGFSVSGSNTLTCTLSGAPGSNPRLSVALPASGNTPPALTAKACLRDTVSGTRSDASTRHTYACHQSIAII
jgi:hypothetical protein